MWKNHVSSVMAVGLMLSAGACSDETTSEPPDAAQGTFSAPIDAGEGDATTDGGQGDATDTTAGWGCVEARDDWGDPMCICSDPPVEGVPIAPETCRGGEPDAKGYGYCGLDFQTHACTCRIYRDDDGHGEYVTGCDKTYLCPDRIVHPHEGCEGTGYSCPGSIPNCIGGGTTCRCEQGVIQCTSQCEMGPPWPATE